MSRKGRAGSIPAPGTKFLNAIDSKLSTQALGGIEEDGTLRWQEQTYDHFNKIVHDRSKRLMAIDAGSVTIGQMSATDNISILRPLFRTSAFVMAHLLYK